MASPHRSRHSRSARFALTHRTRSKTNPFIRSNTSSIFTACPSARFSPTSATRSKKAAKPLICRSQIVKVGTNASGEDSAGAFRTAGSGAGE